VVTNIKLNDVHSGNGPPPIPSNESLSTDAGSLNDSSDGTANDGEWSSLAPGDVITLTATYTITQSDVDTQQ
jgi:large repetitive protein